MHFDFLHFNFLKTLWTLGVAAHIVLLTVLVGRETAGRVLARRFPCFTAFVAIDAVRVLAVYLLYHRLHIAAFYWTSFTLATLVALAQIATLVELAGQIWSRVRPVPLLIAALLAALAVAFWVPWPQAKTLHFDTPAAKLMVMQLFTGKFDEWANFLAVLLALAVLGASSLARNWRSHARQIAVLLGAYAFTLVAVEKITLVLMGRVHPKTADEYNRTVDLFSGLSNSRSIVFLLVLVGLTVLLWCDDPNVPCDTDARPE